MLTSTTMDLSTLKQLGFSDKYAKIYVALLSLGPSSVRQLAAHTGLNRGTTYDGLKWLQEIGAVTFYKEKSKQHFVAENPESLDGLLARRRDELLRTERELDKMIPELQALYHRGGERPVARYFSTEDLHEILEDILETCEQSEEKMYRVYSAEGLRKQLYQTFPTFSDVRIAKGVAVRVIAIGDGGDLRGLDQRKWISQKSEVPTYIMMYPGKTAYVSLNAKGEPVGVVIENIGVYQTQRLIFDQLWSSLS